MLRRRDVERDVLEVVAAEVSVVPRCPGSETGAAHRLDHRQYRRVAQSLRQPARPSLHQIPYHRVVEEYDGALLPESSDDAKARAEAALCRGDRFQDIQDSWPEEIVSVEALAVVTYPELE